MWVHAVISGGAAGVRMLFCPAVLPCQQIAALLIRLIQEAISMPECQCVAYGAWAHYQRSPSNGLTPWHSG